MFYELEMNSKDFTKAKEMTNALDALSFSWPLVL